MLKSMKRRMKATIKKAVDTDRDPYLSKTPPPDGSSCDGCGGVYHHKRWSLIDEKGELNENGAVKGVSAEGVTTKASGQSVVCPACQKKRDDFPGGYVTIGGDFAESHMDEIVNLIRNRETLAMRYNPLDRIIEMRQVGDGLLEVSTTTDKLAQRLGQILKKAYKGEVTYKWSSDINMARVMWTR